MNKTLKKLSLIISIFAIALVGCSGEMTEEKVVEKVLNNYKDTKTLEFDFKQEDKNEQSDNIESKVKLDVANLKVDTNFKIMGMDSKVYAEKKDEKTFAAYINFMGMKWVKTEVDSKEVPLTQDTIAGGMKRIYDMVKKYDVFQLEKKEDSFVLKSDTHTLSKYNQMMDGTKEENVKTEGEKLDVEVTIGNKEFNIASINAFKEGVKEEYISLKNFSKSDTVVEIPKDAIDSATDLKELEEMFNNLQLEPETAE